MEQLRPSSKECCMCGDSGFSFELFHCRVCKRRLQHRYCSNIYPKAESYKVCNWCLHQDDTKDKSHNSSSSATSHAINNEYSKIERENKKGHLVRSQSRNISQLQPNSSIETTRRKIVIRNGKLEEKLGRAEGCQENIRRTRTEDVVSQSNNGVTEPVFRKMKVRRYKFLDEVSS